MQSIFIDCEEICAYLIIMMHKYEATSQPNINVGIVGARGYSGLELARILLAHPIARLTACFATDPTSFTLGRELFSEAAAAVPTLSMTALDALDLSTQFHTIFLATPAEVSLELAPKLIASGVNVIDLSGAFRLPAADYPEWYGFTHTAVEALAVAEYGMVPFAKPFRKPTQNNPRPKGVLVANPGCYVTSVVMALTPLLQADLIETASIVIDAKSGTTGGGKKASEGLLFSEVDGECLPYKIGGHQHYPEIITALKMFAGVETSPFFSTSLLPTPRGIISGIYANLKSGKTVNDVEAAFDKAYADYPLAKHGRVDAKKNPRLLSLKQVVGSNRVQIGYTVDTSNVIPKLYLYSLVDNLLKGAASQAVENWNRLIDCPAALGLLEEVR